MYESGYYRILKDHSSDYSRNRGFAAGNLALVVPTDDTLHVIIGESQYHYHFANEEQMEEFDETFEFTPDGQLIRQQEIAELMQEINKPDDTISQKLIGFSPHVETTGELSSGTGLITAGSNVKDAKLAIAEARNSIMKKQKELSLKTSRLQLMLDEQSTALSIKADQLKTLIEKAEEAIWSINLYLGKNEDIHILRQGKPAPQDEKITIRQLVLYMDEECTANAREGGIDAEDITTFDKWLLASPENVTQVLPETKGIVAFHIKRHRREYEDPWTDAQLNTKNLHWTYLLIRNGERLFRVWVDIVLGEFLLPPVKEYDDLFTVEETDYDDPERRKKQRTLKPGSKEYMKALDASEAKERHYLRMLLVLQGLLDRTPIFKPMPIDRINLCNPLDCEEFLTIVNDAENLLGDGRPSFDDWFAEINSKLDVGQRFIGIFDYLSGIQATHRDGYRDAGRIYPVNARMPDSNTLYTIEDREGDQLIFRYERDEEVRKVNRWGDVSYGKSDVRARCWIQTNDNFIINFDAATVEDMEYYLTSRRHRHAYRRFFPVLEAAIRFKKEEAKTEAPFHKLLVGEIIKASGDDQGEVENKVEELVKWWKFKNRTHRALTSDDTKAVQMIVAEYGIRQVREAERGRRERFEQLAIDVIGAQTPAPILIAHKAGNQYVAYVPSNDMNIWVTEQLWTINGTTSEVRRKETKPWKLVDKRHLRWKIIYEAARWKDWLINPNQTRLLTDPEIEEVLIKALASKELSLKEKEAEVRKKKKAAERRKAAAAKNPPTEDDESSWDDDDDGSDSAELRFLPLCFHAGDEWGNDETFSLWFSSAGPILPVGLLITNDIEEPVIQKTKVTWKRTKGGLVVKTDWPSTYNYRPDGPPWVRDHMSRKVDYRVIKTWDQNIAKIAQEFFDVKALKTVASKLEDKYDYVTDIIKEIVEEQTLAEARRKYDEEFGDPELWEDHLKKTTLEPKSTTLLAEALRLCSERYIDVVGMTVGHVFELAKGLRMFKEGDTTRRRRRRAWVHVHASEGDFEIPTHIPMDFVIPPEPEQALVAVGEDDE